MRLYVLWCGMVWFGAMQPYIRMNPITNAISIINSLYIMRAHIYTVRAVYKYTFTIHVNYKRFVSMEDAVTRIHNNNTQCKTKQIDNNKYNVKKRNRAAETKRSDEERCGMSCKREWERKLWSPNHGKNVQMHDVLCRTPCTWSFSL